MICGDLGYREGVQRLMEGPRYCKKCVSCSEGREMRGPSHSAVHVSNLKCSHAVYYFLEECTSGTFGEELDSVFICLCSQF